jgi:hypothetical protein
MNLNELYKSKKDIIYLTNSLGEKADDIEIPETPYEWYANLNAKTSTLLYFVKLKNQYGIMAVNEYDSVTVSDWFNGNYVAMREMIRNNAALLCENKSVGEYMVFVGEKTGFNGCDELGVFIPYETGYDAIKSILKIIDETAYINQNNKSQQNYDTLYISKNTLLGKFLEQCRKLSNNSSTNIVMGENTVTVYKDEKHNELFDVFYLKKEKTMKKTIIAVFI